MANQPRVYRCTPYLTTLIEDETYPDPDPDDFLIYEDEQGVRHVYDPHKALDRAPSDLARHRAWLNTTSLGRV